MTASEQPPRYPRWATGESALVVEPSEGAKTTGVAVNDIADPGQYNWLGNTTYEWTRHLDERSVGYELLGRDASWVEPTLGYTGPANTAELTATPGVVWLDGRRLELSTEYLASLSEDTHTFVLDRDTYLAVNADRALAFADVAVAAAAPTPAAGYTNVLRVRVTAASPPAVAYLLPTGPTLQGPVEVAGDLSIDGDLAITGVVTLPDIAGPVDIAGAVAVTGDFSATGTVTADRIIFNETFNPLVQVMLNGFGDLAEYTLDPSSQVSAGTIEINNSVGTGLTSITPTVTIAFVNAFPVAPQALVLRNGGQSSILSTWTWTTTSTELVITGSGNAALGNKGPMWRLCWHLLGVS